LKVKDIHDISRHEAQVEDWMEYPHTSLGALFLGVLQYMIAYNNYITAQRRMSEKSLDVKILTWGLTKLPLLEGSHFGF